jgi:hypothetical protein
MMQFPDGRVYEGEWFNGLKNGVGELKTESGVVVYSGDWVEDQPRAQYESKENTNFF